MKDRIIDLLKVKSLITLMVFAVFTVLSIKGSIKAQEFMVVLSMVVTYYFTKQNNDKK